MTNSHNYSFFGKKSAVIVKSSSKNDPFIFIQCLKTDDNGVWEKPSQGEGKIIKLSLEEMIMILEVLQKKQNKWSAYHSFNDNDTQINVNWDSNREKVWFNIGEYRKSLNIAQFEILKMLLKHFLKEKIEFATTRQEKTIKTTRKSKSPTSNSNNSYHNKTERIERYKKPQKEKTILKEEIIQNKPQNYENNGKIHINGKVKRETPKALLILFPNQNEIWVPKSKIYNNFDTSSDDQQEFIIEKWIIEKNLN
ncbi:MAG: hypothetical protein GF317_24355 [Candidatus Lokiarchaeota archaeon]|nr:hypothetical protein [Candidatus Lokiarchaeota archaeon]MBD3202506.1 hypothetical protein [Candidatus Lokiarchaeota archaeon]